MVRVSAALLALLALATRGAAGEDAAGPKQPPLMWGQTEETLFLTVVVPAPVQPTEVWFNDSHVRVDVLAGEPPSRYAAEFELREDVQARPLKSGVAPSPPRVARLLGGSGGGSTQRPSSCQPPALASARRCAGLELDLDY